jgi:DASS family divalent anion:Na+ symporter
MASDTDHPQQPYDWKRTAIGMLALAAVYAIVVYVIPRPPTVNPAGWRLTGIFIATIAGCIIQPIPGGALVLLAVTLASIFGGLTLEQALAGYADKSVWLVMAAFFISGALVKTGLARRIALFFVRMFGKSSLGVSYALAMSDLVLACVIPSNGARSGGVILPIVRSIAELYGSTPGATAAVLGSFLMPAVYQSVCVTSAMFYTGQASNPLAAKIAAGFGYQVTWASWIEASILPGIISLLLVPWVVMKLHPPSVTRTPEASAFAARELREMGSLKHGERILGVVFIFVCAFWVTSSWTKIDVTVTALIGGIVLILTGVLSWEDVKGERTGWDIFIWYGGLLRLGTALNEAGVTKALAEGVGHIFGGYGWMGLFAIALIIYFYAHYAFASITTHLLAMFPAFLAVLLAKGGPPGLMVYAFACFANLSAGLTNYGTTPSPMFFAQGYVSLKKWWQIGLVVSFVNIAVWSLVGFRWWKFLRLW